jgi:hypothetical protein
VVGGSTVIMKFWWLRLRGGGAAIVEAESMVHARLLAVVNDIGRASHVSDGYPIDPHLMDMIPEDFIERTLSPVEADGLLDRLRASEPRGAEAVG